MLKNKYNVLLDNKNIYHICNDLETIFILSDDDIWNQMDRRYI